MKWLTDSQRDHLDELVSELRNLPQADRKRALTSRFEKGEDSEVLSLAAVILQLPRDEEPHRVGQKIDGKFTLLEWIGAGGMGEVWLAEQDSLNRKVAVKLIRADLQKHEEIAKRFLAEIETIKELEDPGIAQIYDRGIHKEASESGERSVPYFAMKYVRGKPITAYVRDANYRLTERIELFIQVCDALKPCHKRGIIHKDLKPDHVLVEAEGRPQLIDFGLAVRFNPSIPRVVQFLSGTPWYMSPEHVTEGFGPISPASDVYSLGIILYELITGHRPYEVPNWNSEQCTEWNLDQRGRAILDAKPDVLRDQLKDCPRGLSKICFRCLEKNPNRRYRTVSELAESLRQYQAKMRRRRALLLSSLSIFLLFVIFSSLLLGQRITSERSKGELTQQVESIREEKHIESMKRRAHQLALRAELIQKQAPEDLQLATQLAIRSLKLYPTAEARNIVLTSLTLLPRPRSRFSLGDIPRSVLFSPNGQFIAACGERGAKVWDLASGSMLLELKPRVAALTLGEEAERVALAGVNAACVWDTASGKQLHRFDFDAPAIRATFSRDGAWLAICDERNAIQIFDLTTGRREARLKSQGNVVAISFNENSNAVIITADKRVEKWDWRQSDIQAMIEQADTIDSAVPSLDRRFLAIVSDDTVTVIEIETGQVIRRISHPIRYDGMLNCLAFDAADRVLVTSSSSETRIWRLNSTVQPLVLDVGSELLALSPLGDYLATSSGGLVAVWDTKTGKRVVWNNFVNEAEFNLVTTKGTWRPVTRRKAHSLMFGPDTGTLLGSGLRGMWQWAWQGSQESSVNVLGEEFAVSADGTCLACATGDSYGAQFDEIRRSNEDLANRGFLKRDGRIAVQWQRIENENRLPQRGLQIEHDIQFTSGLEKATLRGEHGAVETDFVKGVTGIAFEKSRPEIVTRAGGQIQRWAIATGNQLEESSAIVEDGVLPVARPTLETEYDRVVVSGQVAQVFDKATGEEVARMIPEEEIYFATMDPEGKKLATASIEGTIWVWDTNAIAPMCELPHESGIEQIAFTPDGRLATLTSGRVTDKNNVSYTVAKAVRAWSISGEPRGTKITLSKREQSFGPLSSDSRLSPNGRFLATVEGDGSVKVVELSTGGVVATAIPQAVDGYRRNHLVFSQNGDFLAVSTVVYPPGPPSIVEQESHLQVWDITHDRVLWRKKLNMRSVGASRHVYLFGNAVWDPQIGEEGLDVAAQWSTGRTTSDGAYVASADADVVIVSTTRTKQQLASIDRPMATCLRFVPGEHVLAIGSGAARLAWQPTLELWDVDAQKVRWSTPLAYDVGDIVFSPDGRFVTAIADPIDVFERRLADARYISVWDVKTGELVCKLEHMQSVAAATFSPDNKYISTGCEDGVVRIWVLSQSDLVNEAERRCIRQLRDCAKITFTN